MILPGTIRFIATSDISISAGVFRHVSRMSLATVPAKNPGLTPERANDRAANDVLTELAADVVFGLLLLGFGEDGCRRSHFD